ncbi:MAG TPA: NAD(P)/FAD-dependent oxidoreductase [Gemmatimonadales bacterium]|nr:NAD(P)/FAD-dependent oxidoreductase [Gemmatimonadales bacterium]
MIEADTVWDCVIAGGGPAGLSAALMLGRCRRRVLVCDTGQGRNRWSRGVHGVLTRDGIAPAELLRLAREDVARYDTVSLRSLEVVEATRQRNGFALVCGDGTRLRARRLLLATGVADELPSIPGLMDLYGTSVHHCPFCDGYQWRDRPVAVWGRGEHGAGLAAGLTVWTSDLVLCTDGPAGLTARWQRRLALLGIEVRPARISQLEGAEGRLARIVFEDGTALAREAMFFSSGQRQASGLAARLGCRFTPAGAVDTGKCEATDVPGLYVCGDASREAQFVVVAMAEGAEAGMAISRSLFEESLDALESGGRDRPAVPAAG